MAESSRKVDARRRTGLEPRVHVRDGRKWSKKGRPDHKGPRTPCSNILGYLSLGARERVQAEP